MLDPVPLDVIPDAVGIDDVAHQPVPDNVCGVQDGAPAILTEYMLAGLPVLANAGLVCGRQYIRPDTGLTAAEPDFAAALDRLIARHATYDTRSVVQANWTWRHSIQRLSDLIDTALDRHARKVSA